MTKTHMLYRDPRTGKIWEYIGGQEPREIDEDYARRINLNVDSIPFLKQETEEKTICPNCGTVVKKASFCTECGERLHRE